MYLLTKAIGVIYYTSRVTQFAGSGHMIPFSLLSPSSPTVPDVRCLCSFELEWPSHGQHSPDTRCLSLAFPVESEPLQFPRQGGSALWPYQSGPCFPVARHSSSRYATLLSLSSP